MDLIDAGHNPLRPALPARAAASRLGGGAAGAERTALAVLGPPQRYASCNGTGTAAASGDWRNPVAGTSVRVNVQ